MPTHFACCTHAPSTTHDVQRCWSHRETDSRRGSAICDPLTKQPIVRITDCSVPKGAGATIRVCVRGHDLPENQAHRSPGYRVTFGKTYNCVSLTVLVRQMRGAVNPGAGILRVRAIVFPCPITNFAPKDARLLLVAKSCFPSGRLELGCA
jgi:hypothetical protein